MAKSNFPRILSFFIFPALVFFFSEFASLTFDAYNVFPWFDIPMHLLGGFSIAYTSYLFLKFFKGKKLVDIKSNFVWILIVVSLVCMVAVFWEFYEFISDQVFGTLMQPSVRDTITDLFMGFFGGFVGSVVFRKK